MMRATGAVAGRVLPLALLLGATLALSLRAQDPPPKDKEKPKTAVKLPSGAIIIVTGSPDALDKPDAVYLSAEKYRELAEQIEQLKKQVSAAKPTPPSSCEIEGRVEQRGGQQFVRLKAAFKFQTTLPRSLISLGCQKAHAVDAKLEDGRLPMLTAGEKGMTVQIEAAGEHTVRLDLEAPLLPRGKGGEVGFEVGLPGAPITLLTFEAPPKVKRIAVARREAGAASPVIGLEAPPDVRRFDAERLAPGRGGEALGPVTHLSISWEEAGLASAADAARSADAEILVTVGDTDIRAEARLRFRGAAKEWRFLAPQNAEVSVSRASPSGSSSKATDFPSDQAPDLIRPEPGQSVWRARFRETNSAELLVTMTTRTPRNRDPKGRTHWPVGPFAAIDVPKQSGTVRVRTAPHVRAAAVLRGDTQRVDGGDDQGAEAVYHYHSLPPAGKDLPGPPLELDVRATVGVVQTRVLHSLSLAEGGWRLHSDIAVTPIRSEVEALDVEVPVPGVFEASTPKLVEGVVPLRDLGPKRRVIQIRLAVPQRSEFSVALEGFYPLPLGASGATIVLPRLLDIVDRSGQVTVSIPEGIDLRGGVRQWEGDRPGTRITPLEAANGTERPPALTAEVIRTAAQVELTWKPVRADVRAESRVEVRLGDRQGHVTQVLHLTFADRPLRRLRLRGPSSLSGVQVNPRSIDVNGPGDWSVPVPPDPGKEITLTLTYSFPIPEATINEAARLSVPLVWPESVTSCTSHLRFWRDRNAEGHLIPVLENGPWQTLPADLAAGEAGFPLLALAAEGANLPLTVILRDAGAGPASLPEVWIDRALIQSQPGAGGQQYRVRLHLARWVTRSLDLELPASSVKVEARVGEVTINSSEAIVDAGGTRVLRLPLPVWSERKRLTVEVRYQAPADRDGGWVLRWQPPRPQGRVTVAASRWQISVPSRLTALSFGDQTLEERWNFRGGLLRTAAAHGTAELEKWLAEGQEPVGSPAKDWEMADANVTLEGPGLVPLQVVAVPVLLWIFAVSLVVLFAGLLIARLPRRAIGASLAMVSAVVVIAGFLWPQPAGQALAAAEPGLLLLIVILTLRRFVEWRYRRRLARMPGFSRVHAESSLARANGKRVAQTSTVDGPASS
jgi:hypothetical protein